MRIQFIMEYRNMILEVELITEELANLEITYRYVPSINRRGEPFEESYIEFYANLNGNDIADENSFNGKIIDNSTYNFIVHEIEKQVEILTEE